MVHIQTALELHYKRQVTPCQRNVTGCTFIIFLCILFQSCSTQLKIISDLGGRLPMTNDPRIVNSVIDIPIKDRFILLCV